MTARLTHRQWTVLEYIENSIALRGFPPTIREISRHIGATSSQAGADHMRALVRKGYVSREEGVARGLRVLIPTSAVESQERPQPPLPGPESSAEPEPPQTL